MRGCIEMSVKIIWEATGQEPEPRDGDHHGAGTSFLEQKRREILGDERSAAEANDYRPGYMKAVGDLIRAEQVTLRPSAEAGSGRCSPR